ncbi:hypothetical protein FW774_08935 [Pedobacter sp. BS3]|uniref:hypothetical protein n=1 Tax=Pedobacter sp. BS3 TaxID=2567937 RepID=UPI0011EC0BD0|nr:hypothetical protein [Pedobacter sp. BS3]TZF83594.1 hypothetical protein FW774_08935 [Pedobacter sp. BS3]
MLSNKITDINNAPYFLALLQNFPKKKIAYTLNGENCVILKSQPYHNLIVKVIDHYVSVNLVSSFVYLKFPHFNDVNQFYYKLESHGPDRSCKNGQ